MNDDREEEKEHDMIEAVSIQRACSHLTTLPAESVFHLDSDASDYDYLCWFDDSSNPSDYALRPDCLMSALSSLCLETSPAGSDFVRYDENPICLESSYHGRPRTPRGTLSDTEFDYSGSSGSHRVNQTVSSRSAYSSNSPIFNFPSSINQYPGPHLTVNLARTFVSTFKTVHCGRNSECLISSKAFTSGYHEWSIKIKECGVGMQEIGIITLCDTDKVIVDGNGDVTIGTNHYFGARAVYGCCSKASDPYYASFNMDNKSRCSRQLRCQSVGSRDSRHKWAVGDIVTVCVNMDLLKVKFVKNGKAVRKSMSLQRGSPYYPCISFAGRCRYDVVCVQ